MDAPSGSASTPARASCFDHTDRVYDGTGFVTNSTDEA
jgi:hypothetical protein